MTVTAIAGFVVFVSFVALQLLYIFFPIFLVKRKVHVEKRLRQTKMSVLIPAYNEETVIKSCLEGILSLDYHNYEVIFINDGSNDSTLDTLIELLDAKISKDHPPSGQLTYAPVINVYQSKKYQNIWVIDKMNGGKADSLNAGIDYATGKIVITLDADSILEPSSLQYINARFKDKKVIGAGGMVHVGQMFDQKKKIWFKGKGLLKYQLSDYLTSFYLRRMTHSAFNVLAIVSGAFGAFRREILQEIGGYKKSLGEDMEITLNIQRLMNTKYKDSKLIFIPEAICYTEVPESLRDVFKQRIRWQKGFIDCLVRYRKSFIKGFHPRFTFFLLWDSLVLGFNGVVTAVMIPIIFLLRTYDTLFITTYATCLTLQITSRLVAYFIASHYNSRFSKIDYTKIVFFTLIETFTYRILDPIVFAYGTLFYFIGNRHNWNKVKRLGHVTVNESKIIVKHKMEG